MAQRNTPYGAFNYIVEFDGGEILGGFSDVSGLGFEVNYSDYRNGNEMVNTVRHIPNTFKNDEITLKRGLVGSPDLFKWLQGVRDGTADARTVTITLLDEARSAVAVFKLQRAQPKKWMGPTLAATREKICAIG